MPGQLFCSADFRTKTDNYLFTNLCFLPLNSSQIFNSLQGIFKQALSSILEASHIFIF